jgi:hypothetical protein
LAKQLVYQVKVGQTPAFYDNCIASVARYCKRIGAEHRVQTEPLLRIAPKRSYRSANALRLGYLPIMEKANAFSHLGEFDQVAVIDADIYVRDCAPNLFDEGGYKFAAVLEREMPVTQKYREKLRKYSDGQYGLLKDVDWKWDASGAAFYNMGMMLLDASVAEDIGDPEHFIRRPEFERFVNGEGHWKWSTDQTLLNYWVKKSGISVRNLSWKWNALYDAVNIDVIKEAYFVHFFLSANLPQQGREIPSIINKL